MNSNSVSVGIDIGTTSISAAIVDHGKCSVVDSHTVPYNYNITTDSSSLCEQDPSLICSTALNLVNEITTKYTNVSSIGVTGQMHGILCVDEIGNPISNLINWQDKRGERIHSDGITYCEKILEISCESVPTGYGFASLFYNYENKIVPDKTYTFCSIMDYLVMKLTGNPYPVIHSTVAKSFGLYDDVSCNFKSDLIKKLGINIPVLPETTDEYRICGTYKGIPVSIAIGDNQASFLGSVKDIENSILLNIGTGSQISAVTDSFDTTADLEIRPLVKDRYIKCGSALCGGSAYALLEGFFKEYQLAAGLDRSSQYDTMNKLATEAYYSHSSTPTVNTCFKGRRSDPSLTGSITGITTDNFTPGAIALGFIKGICNELYEMFDGNTGNKTTVIASGNAVQKIEIFKEIISDTFSLPVKISSTKEEASVGAALFSAVSANILDGVHSFCDYINYN